MSNNPSLGNWSQGAMASVNPAYRYSGQRFLAYQFDDERAEARTVNGRKMGNGNLWYTVSHDHLSGRHTVRWETYTSFNMPREILFGNLTQPSNPTATVADRKLSYTYGPEHQRVRMTTEFTGNAPSHMREQAGTTWYLNGQDSQGLMYEREVRANGMVEERHFLNAAGMTFAVAHLRSGTLGGKPAQEVHYWHHDHLGSVAAVSNASGQVIERMAYDPWGKRRNTNGLGDPLDQLWAQTTDRGYTQHEHLDEVGVIHMNGRIYDSLIGRFMSADPFIQAIENLQNHNRYAYVMNNPLAYTDPNGYFFKKLFRAVVAIGVAVYAPQMIFTAWAGSAAAAATAAGTTLTVAQVTTMYVGSGAMAGALSGAIGSGSSKGALQGALTGGLFAAAGLAGTGATAAERASSASRYVAHAAAGCVSAVAGGGQCGQGAASSVFGKYTTNALTGFGGNNIQGVIARGVATSVAGGVGSEIAGGKFANGAETAAYGYLFNQVQSKVQKIGKLCGPELCGGGGFGFGGGMGGGGRRGALNDAKRDLKISRSQHPESIDRVAMTDKNRNNILDADGRRIMTREYTYKRSDGSKVLIQEHSAGHPRTGGVGAQGPHFNVRPPEDPRTGHVPGTKDHYSW